MSGLRLTGNILGGAALIVALSLGASAPAPGAAQVSAGNRSINLGRNASGDICTADSNWTDAAAGEFVKTVEVFSVTCSGAVTNALARVRLFKTAGERNAASAGLQCGEASPVTLPGFTRASARRCYDPALGFATVLIDADTRGYAVQISAAPNAVGAAYQAALSLTGGSDGEVRADRTPINLASLAPLPANVAEAATASGPRENVESVLARATALNLRGLSADASRFLRGELSRLAPDTNPKVRADLLLEAGLAESNIRFFGSADANLESARAVINLLNSGDKRALQAKLDTYRGLDALNQKQFAKARDILSANPDAGRSGSGLTDAAQLAQLNNASSDISDPRNAISQPDLDLFREAVIGVQRYWALSVAELTLGNPGGAQAAITTARGQFKALEASLSGQRVMQDGLYWLDARLVRQQGRVQAESGQFAAAIASFDQAIETIDAAGKARGFAANDPAVAELKLERAALIERSGAAANIVEREYDAALDALLAARERTSGLSTGLLNPYLDRLAARMATGDKVAASRYFAALQVSGESSAARQINQLQNIVGADENVAGPQREREQLTLRLNQLTSAIPDAQALAKTDEDRARVTALEGERRTAERRLSEVEAALAGNARLAQVTDRPADLAALQKLLKPGEAYVRLTVMNDKVYGILIEGDKATAIRPTRSADELLVLTGRMRASVAFNSETRSIPGFNISAAQELYQAVFGGVDAQLRRNGELVIDGGQLFSGITAGMLVTDADAAQKFVRQANKRDYSQVAFLAKQVSTSVASSPSSFTTSRQLPSTKATRPLLGLAAPLALGEQAVGQNGKLYFGKCEIDAADYASAINRLSPIASTEIDLVSTALGLTGAPAMISGAAFSDTGLARRGRPDGGDLKDYKILHFATHGVTEGRLGCADFPAGLLTSRGDSGTSDLLLSYDEIASLRLDANLVVLSACETASQVGEGAQRRAGEAQPGGTLDGLVRAFFAAGSRSVMATFWETSNAGQSEAFMTAFYNAARDRSITQAASQAQRTLLSDPATSHPFFWAGFFVVGQTENRVLADAQTRVAAR